MNPVDRSHSLDADYFDRVYTASADPWSFETSAYEAAKYDTTLNALGDRRFEQAFEIGCSIGVLTARLAPRCRQLLAVDVSDAPLQAARQRCAGLAQVSLRRMAVPREFPAQRFDLVMLSEVGYYWSPPDLLHAAALITASLEPGGLWMLVHWTPPVPDYPLTGDEVHECCLALARESGQLRHVLASRKPSYRIDLLQRTELAATPGRDAA